MSTAEYIFQSDPDARGYATRLTIDPSRATIKSIKLLEAGRVVLTLTTSPISLFCIRFTKYDLDANRYSLTADGKKQTIEYKVTSALNYTPAEGRGELGLKYASVPPSQTGFDNIQVSMTFRRPPTAVYDRGWIDLDISYTYPSQCVSGDAHTAWEVELIYPEICLTTSRLSGYLLLDPIGRLGSFNGMAAEEKVNLMPLQFAAFYKAGKTGGGVNYLRGVALSATDQEGQVKSLRYRPLAVGSAQARAVSFHLTTPIHLKNNAYVRPANTYRLSGGRNDAGFSGAKMNYRIRAFDVRGAAPDLPVDWYDVADIYRAWLEARRPSFYSKYNDRFPVGHTYAMSPLTVVSNYGLDGQVEPAATDLAKWLEIHPIVVDGSADMPGNNPGQEGRNESLQEILLRIKGRFGAVPNLRLEAQIWGFEMEGFYQALGAHPPATDVLTGAGRFSKALAELSAAGIVPSATTDPLNTNFSRGRYRGHLIRYVENGTEVWRPAVSGPFPSDIVSAAAAGGVVTQVAGNDRVFHALDSADAATTGSTGADRGSQKLDGFGNRRERFEALTRFYNIYGRHLCPTPTVQSFYVNTCLKERLLAYGFKHIEFMKHFPGDYFCYDKSEGHKHLQGQPAVDEYDNVIGRGPWYFKRLKAMLRATHDAGVGAAPDDFALVNEAIFPEVLVPYFDEFYEYEASSFTVYRRDSESLRPAPVFWYVYSRHVSMKMNLADTGPYVHPGYREQALVEPLPAPTFMLDGQMDADAKNIPYASWRHKCREYNDPNFGIASHGLAPRDYPANTQTGQNPTEYTYRRCVEEVFNLRSHFFRYGEAAVMGERIYIFAKLFEGFTVYTDEAINAAVSAAHMQMKFPQFFRGGRMLGQTRIAAGNAMLWTWRAHNRQFSDVALLVQALYTNEEINGVPEQQIAPLPITIHDFISRGVDKLHVVPHGAFDYDPAAEPDLIRGASKVTTDAIQHMVWDDAEGAVLYTFANVSNTTRAVSFLCGRGLEGANTWKRTDYTFAGDPTGAPITRTTATFNQQGSIDIAPRTCAAVLFEL